MARRKSTMGDMVNGALGLATQATSTSSQRRSSTMGDLVNGTLGLTTPATSSSLQRRSSSMGGRGSIVLEGIDLAVMHPPSQPASHLRRRNTAGNINAPVRSSIAGTSASLVDDGVDAVLTGAFIQTPPCCEPCTKSKLGQFLLNPADHATRHQRKGHGKEGGDGEGAGTVGHSRRFGFKDFSQAGFALVPPGDVQMPDRTVFLILNLQLAVHRKTSVERYCHAVHKSKIPAGPSEVKSVVRQLLRLDHINILRCHEVLEDDNMIYLLYEYWPCNTLMSVLDDAKWNESDMANLVRECAAAMAYASSMNVLHLGFSLYNILVPAHGNARPLKVFGFGLAGVFTAEGGDKQFWSPESAEKFMQFGGNHLTKLEPAQRWPSDSWSLGCIVYSIIARRPPIIGGPDTILAKVSECKRKREWAFSPAFDDCDVECKALVEALLDPFFERRLKAEAAFQHEWIKKRKGNAHRDIVGSAYAALHTFCDSPKSKKLFGRFLVRFLSAGQRREIAVHFSTLDSKGDGVIDKTELEHAAVQAHLSKSSVKVIMEWFDVGPKPEQCISLHQFCETLAEEVIDGRALRHAFESLDEDGSEEITAQELFDVLKLLDDSLTLDEVIQHVDAAEGQAGETGGNGDNALDFSEFTQLFPVRMQRIAALESRLQSAKSEAGELAKKFESVKQPIQKWIRGLDNNIEEIAILSQKTIDRKEDGVATTKNLRKYVGKVSDNLKKPPGDQEFNIAENTLALNARVNKLKKRRSSTQGEGADMDVFGFDNFIQVQSILENWPQHLADETRLLKQALLAGGGVGKEGDNVDRFKAYDAAESAVTKIREVSKWARDQTSEYESLSEAITTFETPLHPVSMSGRGLRKAGDDDDNHEDEDAGAEEQSKERTNKDLVSRFFGDAAGQTFNSVILRSCSARK